MHLIDCHAPLCDCSMAACDLWVCLPLHHRTDPGHVCIWAQPCLSCFLERVNMTNFCSTQSNYTFVDFEFVLWLLAIYTLLKWMEVNLQKPILFFFLHSIVFLSLLSHEKLPSLYKMTQQTKFWTRWDNGHATNAWDWVVNLRMHVGAWCIQYVIILHSMIQIYVEWPKI